MTPYPSNEEIEKRIDERSTVHHQEGFFDYGDDDCPAEVNLERIKCFISQTRLSDLDAIIEEIESYVGKAQEHPMFDGTALANRFNDGYSSALNIVLSYLTSLKDQK